MLKSIGSRDNFHSIIIINLFHLTKPRPDMKCLVECIKMFYELFSLLVAIKMEVVAILYLKSYSDFCKIGKFPEFPAYL